MRGGLILLLVSFWMNLLAQNYLPYPVIFVHGLTGSDQTFAETFTFMSQQYNLDEVNVFDIVLNADNDNSSAIMSEDVKWEDFRFSTWYGDYFINVGRRNYAEDMDNFVDGWRGVGNLFAINFKEERIRGAAGLFNDLFDYSDQAAIFKQGYALRQMIAEVLEYTGAEKVILVGHSMGGLAIREYLQRTDENGLHVNWVDPYSPDGHKVAAVVTYGTPHLGSNSGFDPTKSLIPEEQSEAIRDLKYSYDSYTNCSGEPVGIYLFGGYEYCIASTWWNSTFFNVDVNCDGDESDYIVGIDYETYDNPAMPLPKNVHYTWITALWADLGGNLVGDGVVNIDRQWLHIGNEPAPLGITDTLLTDKFHTQQGSDYKNIIRGLDEPDVPQFAYNLKFYKNYLGFITFQPNYQSYDIDYFKVAVNGNQALIIELTDSYGSVDEVEILDKNFNLIASFSPMLQNSVQVLTLGIDSVYIRVNGLADANSWLYPYILRIEPITTVFAELKEERFEYYITGNQLVIKVGADLKVRIYDINGRLLLEEEGSELNFSLPVGIYVVKAYSGNYVKSFKVVIP